MRSLSHRVAWLAWPNLVLMLELSFLTIFAGLPPVLWAVLRWVPFKLPLCSECRRSRKRDAYLSLAIFLGVVGVTYLVAYLTNLAALVVVGQCLAVMAVALFTRWMGRWMYCLEADKEWLKLSLPNENYRDYALE